MMRRVANKWWFAMLSLGVYLLGDFASNVVQFASSLPDDATMGSITFKHWISFWGSCIMSGSICFKMFTSGAWGRAAGTNRTDIPVNPAPVVTMERTDIIIDPKG